MTQLPSAAISRYNGIKLATLTSVSAYLATQAAYASFQDEVPTSESRVRYMPPSWLDRVRAQNISKTLPESLSAESSFRGRVCLVAPPGLDDSVATQLVETLNRLVPAAEDHAQAIGYGDHIKGHTWNLVIRKLPSMEASTLDGTVFLTAGLVGMLRHESKAWQASLAGIVAHELGHNLARHVLENQLDYLKFRWGLVLRLPWQFLKAAYQEGGLPPGDWVDRWHDREVGALCRQREHEADELAVSILARAGFPPDSLASTLPMLDGNLAAYTSTQASLSAKIVAQLRTALSKWWSWQALNAQQASAPQRLWHTEQPRGLEKGVGRVGGGAGEGLGEDGCPDTHPPLEERVARMRRLAAAEEVQTLYRRHSWWERYRLSRQ